MADFIQTNIKGVIISTNNIMSLLDLQEIEKYVKSTLCAVADQIDSPRLPQLKSYLKIVGIPYLSKISNFCLSSDEVDENSKG